MSAGYLYHPRRGLVIGRIMGLLAPFESLTQLSPRPGVIQLRLISVRTEPARGWRAATSMLVPGPACTTHSALAR